MVGLLLENIGVGPTERCCRRRDATQFAGINVRLLLRRRTDEPKLRQPFLNTRQPIQIDD